MGSLFSSEKPVKKVNRATYPIINSSIEMGRLMQMQTNIAYRAGVINRFLNNFCANQGKPVLYEDVEKTAETCNKLVEDFKVLQDVLVFIREYHAEKRTISDDQLVEMAKDGLLMFEPDSIKELGQAITNQTHNYSVPLTNENPLFAEVREITAEQFNYAKVDVSDGTWKSFCKNGELQLYHRELNEDDTIKVPPLKAMNSARGITAKEYIDIYYDPELKTAWDTSIDASELIETIKPNLVIIHQTHKWVPPVAQRESVIWAHKCDVTKYRDPGAFDAYLVCHHDIDRDDIELKHHNNIRVKLKVGMLCQTFIDSSKKDLPLSKLTRKDVTCKVIYVAQIDPCGFVPKAVMMEIYKREFPKFLRNFTNFVRERVNDTPLKLDTPQENGPLACNF